MMTETMQALRDLQKKLYAFQFALNVIDFDAQTVAPSESYPGRGEALEVLSGIKYSLIADPGAPWRAYIDLEHAQIYEPENCWMALTDGRRKYIRNARTGEEQLFDLENDPGECRDLAGEEQYAAELRTWRTRLTAHLAERDARYVRNGELQIITEKIIYSPNYPGSTAPATPREQQKLREWRREATAWR